MVGLWDNGEDQEPKCPQLLCSGHSAMPYIKQVIQRSLDLQLIGNMPKQADTQTAGRDRALIK